MSIYSSFCLAMTLLLVSCVSTELDRTQVAKIEEFDKVVKIEKIPQPKPVAPTDSQSAKKSKSKKKTKVEAAKGSKKVVKKQTTPKQSSPPKPALSESKPKNKKTSGKRLPRLEDDEGFVGRRPIKDPFRVGEETVLGVSYFGVEAGKFTMQVQPMVQVNGKKSYHFKYTVKSSPLFSMFYRANDVAETFVDYNTLLPHHYEIHVDESKQVRETKTFFDHKKLKAMMWDQKQKKGGKLEKKKIQWDLLRYSQNVFSAGFYLRNFTLKVGKEFKVRVGHEGKNIVMTAKVVRKEKIYTALGPFNTFVVKPKFEVEGKFKAVGENYLWLTDDDRKFIVKLESKIKIGTIVGKLQKLQKQ